MRTICWLLTLSLTAIAFGQTPTTRNVTFLATSDCHYIEAARGGARNQGNRDTIDEMNRIAERNWPDKADGKRIDAPLGVLVLGDCIDDGDKAVNGKSISQEQYGYFLADFGLDGKDGRLKFPVFEGWGNHDGPPVGKEVRGFSFQANLKTRNAARLKSGAISNLSANDLHYSWDWADVHFVQLNLYPADRQSEGVRYSPTWHNPQDALTFLKKDLAERVGTSGRPVVLMSHCGFDTNWWPPSDWKALYDTAKQYNVVLYLYGHTATGVRTWAPEGESQKWQCINTGQTEKGFFVVQLIGDRVNIAMRTKTNHTTTKNENGSVTRTWDNSWGWKDLKQAQPKKPQRVNTP